jgi:hypothetical protein
VRSAFLARLGDTGFNPVAENISFEFRKDRNSQEMPTFGRAAPCSA